MIKFFVNGDPIQFNGSTDTPLLWVIRDSIGLTGTKFGCGVAQCGACTVHVNGEATRSCVTPVASLEGKRISTIEGLPDNAVNKAVRTAWLDKDVVQCGYCQPGQIMSATALLAKNPKPSDADIDAAMDGNLCRCGTYQRIREAVKSAAAALPAKK